MTQRFLQKRQAFQPEDGFESTTEGLLVEEPETGVTLGQILGSNQSDYFHDTGCFVFTDIFQEPLIGTSNAQLLMTNDSFSSQTWAILYLNETLIKSQNRTQPNDSPVRCQNQEYFQTHMNLP